MVCIKCSGPIPISCKSEKYCSKRCSKNYLKAVWRKKHHEEILAYNRKRRGNDFSKTKGAEFCPKRYCLRCGIKENLNYHHIRPTEKDGPNKIENIIVLCFKCHMLWHKIFPDFYWD